MKLVNFAFVFVSLVICTILAAVPDEKDGETHDAPWGYKVYDGLMPEDWKINYTTCSKDRQSPVNIDEASTVYDAELTPLVLKNYNTVFNNIKFHLTNNGHTVFCGLEYAEEIPVTITWKGNEYIFYSFHFHWGHYDQQGSEHELNGRSYPLEVHLIHYKKAYGNFSQAIQHGDGLLVYGTFYQIGEKHDGIQKLIDLFPEISYKNMRKDFPSISLDSIVSTDITEQYYHYEGSLTTPGCNEIVMWIVNRNIHNISEAQVAEFRKLHSTEKNATIARRLDDNYRPVQPLARRKVFASFKKAAEPEEKECSGCNLAINIFVLMAAMSLAHLMK